MRPEGTLIPGFEKVPGKMVASVKYEPWRFPDRATSGLQSMGSQEWTQHHEHAHTTINLQTHIFSFCITHIPCSDQTMAGPGMLGGLEWWVGAIPCLSSL